MSLSEIGNLQDEMISKKYPSSAVGRYQIDKSTLQEWSKQEGMDPDKTIYNEETQDRLLKRGLINAGLEKFKKESDIIIANRISDDIKDVLNHHRSKTH